MVGRTRVALVSSNPGSGFVQADADLLRRLEYEVSVAGRPTAIWRAVRRSDRVVCWLAGEHAFYAELAARLRGVPILLILGGVEGEPVDSPVHASLWLRPWHVRARARYAIRHATELWTVEPSLADRTFAHGGLAPRAYRAVHTVFDPARFRVLPKQHDVVFACPSAHPAYHARKGLPDVLNAARKIPQVSFVVVGTDPAGGAPPNVRFSGFLAPDAYANALGAARVVVNASLYEGLNNSLCEAMLGGAVPVVADIPGNRYAVEGLELARVFPRGDVARLSRGVVDAVRVSREPGVPEQVRSHVLRRFPVEARAQAFRRFLGPAHATG